MTLMASVWCATSSSLSWTAERSASSRASMASTNSERSSLRSRERTRELKSFETCANMSLTCAIEARDLRPSWTSRL